MFTPDALSTRRVLITGGGSGLGLAMARRFVELGARVFITGRSEDRLESATRAIGVPDRVAYHPCDVRDRGAVDAVVEVATDRFGGIDTLINNAAGNFLAASEDLSENAFDAIVRIVLHGTFNMTQSVGRRMIESGEGGSIVNIVATYAWTGSAFVLPSACAKAGVLAMTRSLAVEWAAYGIRVNAIAPGPFPTEGAWSRLMPDEASQQAALSRIPAGRFGDPAELANLAAFIAGDASPYVTGECITIDGARWLATGGEFNALAREPRSELKEALEALRARRDG